MDDDRRPLRLPDDYEAECNYRLRIALHIGGMFAVLFASTVGLWALLEWLNTHP